MTTPQLGESSSQASIYDSYFDFCEQMIDMNCNCIKNVLEFQEQSYLSYFEWSQIVYLCLSNPDTYCPNGRPDSYRIMCGVNQHNSPLNTPM